MAVKKVKVKMLVNTAYQGPRKEGEVVSVPEDFARRWVKNGIAEFVTDGQVQEPDGVNTQEPVVEPEGTDDVTGQEPEKENPYEGMKAKELYDLCIERGIEVEQKKSKEYYIEKLTEADAE